ncbi:MAG: peptidase M75 [Symploca sp. SIO3C6]|uniref:Peptidase M75 n=1 Tax=Symploca sp. SIO1C4 TaxID=2607765 RepID=A0A6B3N7C4_9CYAN|nr:peptidase M75 [Symploca sp. SIO3C6]NER29526.1 peptidase M75 [Symploca sp. SIO1C4]NET05569.1 peptidase M75 [Symploca sp. SIO2B6]
MVKESLSLPIPRHWLSRSIWLVLCSSLLTLSNGCTNPSAANANSSLQSNQLENQISAGVSGLQAIVVRDFADQVVVPTYEQLVVKAGLLSATVEALVKNPNQQTLQAAQQSWIVARSPWEQSEAFAFGPADSLGYDGDLDDWPVNETDVKAVLESNDQLTLEYVQNLQTTQKGFHTIELLLFGADNNRSVTDFSPRKLEYLKFLAEAFNQSANDLLTSWVKGVNGNPPYRQVLATAGDIENRAYPTVNAGVEEIVQGMLGCLDEVANEKIGEPLETKETEGLESRFSHTSLEDFKNNLLSAKNAYLGEVPEAGTSGKSLSNYVAQLNPELDQQVRREMQRAIEAIAAIPTPIETKINQPDAQVKMEAAQQAVLKLHSTIEQEVLPLVQG